MNYELGRINGSLPQPNITHEADSGVKFKDAAIASTFATSPQLWHPISFEAHAAIKMPTGVAASLISQCLHLDQ
jgi:hypothetical protein